MTPQPLELDVRPVLRAGGEPFGEIMAAVERLQPRQALRLFATFRPTPLFSVMQTRGFRYEARPLADGEWEVLFEPAEAEPAPAPAAAFASDWPAPAHTADFRDLPPPEPMARTLELIEAMRPGEVLSVVLCREPVFLLPHLKARGHDWRGALDADGQRYDLSVRVGEPLGEAS